MSMCPTWRAVSSITWATTQRSVVGRASGPASEVERRCRVQHGVGGRRLGPVEGDDLVDRPAVGQLEHVLAPGHVHRLTREEDPHPEPLRVAEVHDDRTERVRVRGRTPAELVLVEVLELEDGALPQVGQPRRGPSFSRRPAPIGGTRHAERGRRLPGRRRSLGWDHERRLPGPPGPGQPEPTSSRVERGRRSSLGGDS